MRAQGMHRTASSNETNRGTGSLANTVGWSTKWRGAKAPFIRRAPATGLETCGISSWHLQTRFGTHPAPQLCHPFATGRYRQSAGYATSL